MSLRDCTCGDPQYDRCLDCPTRKSVARCECGHALDAHDPETGWCMTVLGVVRHNVKDLQNPIPVYCSCEGGS